MKKTCAFCAGVLAVWVVVLGAVMLAALDAARFERAVLAHVNGASVGMDAGGLSAFARHTMDYLAGRLSTWQPDVPFVMAEGFAQHMAEVRRWVDVLRAAMPLGALLAAGGLLLSRRSMLHGVLSMLGILLGMLLWAAVDFHSLWRIIHLVLIPGGIFPAGEAIMQLFPLSLFYSYIGPAVGWMAAGFALLFAALFLTRACKG